MRRGALLARGDVRVPFGLTLEYNAWSIQGPLGPTTFGCQLHFRCSPLGEDYSSNAPEDADTRSLTGLFSRLAVLSKQLLWISHSTLTDNIQVTLHLGISSVVSLLGVRQAGI